MPEEQQIQCLIQILNMTWAEACGHLKGAKLCLGGSRTSGCSRLMCQRRKALWWHLACSCFFFLSQSELIFLFTLCFPKCWSLTVRKCIFNFLEWPSIPQDFSLCVADWAKRKIKVHLKRKEGNFVQVFPLPTLKNECSSNHTCSEGNWKQNAFYEVQFSSDAKWSLCILWCGETAKVNGVGKRAEPRTM